METTAEDLYGRMCAAGLRMAAAASDDHEQAAGLAALADGPPGDRVGGLMGLGLYFSGLEDPRSLAGALRGLVDWAEGGRGRNTCAHYLVRVALHCGADGGTAAVLLADSYPRLPFEGRRKVYADDILEILEVADRLEPRPAGA